MCPVRWKYLFVEFEILFPDERTQFQGFGLVSFTRMNTKWCHQTDLKLGGGPFARSSISHVGKTLHIHLPSQKTLNIGSYPPVITSNRNHSQ